MEHSFHYSMYVIIGELWYFNYGDHAFNTELNRYRYDTAILCQQIERIYYNNWPSQACVPCVLCHAHSSRANELQIISMKRWHSAQLVRWSADCSVSAETPAGALTSHSGPALCSYFSETRLISPLKSVFSSACESQLQHYRWLQHCTAHITSHVSWQLSRMSRRHSTTAALRVNIGDKPSVTSLTSVATAAAAWKSLGKSDIYDVWIFRGSAVWLDRIFGTLDCHLRRIYFILDWSRPPVLPPCLGWSTIIN